MKTGPKDAFNASKPWLENFSVFDYAQQLKQTFYSPSEVESAIASLETPTESSDSPISFYQSSVRTKDTTPDTCYIQSSQRQHTMSSSDQNLPLRFDNHASTNGFSIGRQLGIGWERPVEIERSSFSTTDSRDRSSLLDMGFSEPHAASVWNECRPSSTLFRNSVDRGTECALSNKLEPWQNPTSSLSHRSYQIPSGNARLWPQETLGQSPSNLPPINHIHEMGKQWSQFSSPGQHVGFWPNNFLCIPDSCASHVLTLAQNDRESPGQDMFASNSTSSAPVQNSPLLPKLVEGRISSLEDVESRIASLPMRDAANSSECLTDQRVIDLHTTPSSAQDNLEYNEHSCQLDAEVDGDKKKKKKKTTRKRGRPRGRAPVSPKMAPTTIRQDRAKDSFLIESRKSGMTYAEIREKGNFTVAESTLRGRYRFLTKEKHERVRRPKWQNEDIFLLNEAVQHVQRVVMTTSEEVMVQKYRARGKLPWKMVSEYIKSHGGSYHFGSSACRKKWEEISASDTEQTTRDP